MSSPMRSSFCNNSLLVICLTGKSYFRDGAAWAFFSVEVISIIENVGLIYPLPKFVTKAIDWLHNRSDALADAVPDADADKGGDTK